MSGPSGYNLTEVNISKHCSVSNKRSIIFWILLNASDSFVNKSFDRTLFVELSLWLKNRFAIGGKQSASLQKIH